MYASVDFYNCQHFLHCISEIALVTAVTIAIKIKALTGQHWCSDMCCLYLHVRNTLLCYRPLGHPCGEDIAYGRFLFFAEALHHVSYFKKTHHVHVCV